MFPSVQDAAGRWGINSMTWRHWKSDTATGVGTNDSGSWRMTTPTAQVGAPWDTTFTPSGSHCRPAEEQQTGCMGPQQALGLPRRRPSQRLRLRCRTASPERPSPRREDRAGAAGIHPVYLFLRQYHTQPQREGFGRMPWLYSDACVLVRQSVYLDRAAPISAPGQRHDGASNFEPHWPSRAPAKGLPILGP